MTYTTDKAGSKTAKSAPTSFHSRVTWSVITPDPACLTFWKTASGVNWIFVVPCCLFFRLLLLLLLLFVVAGLLFFVCLFVVFTPRTNYKQDPRGRSVTDLSLCKLSISHCINYLPLTPLPHPVRPPPPPPPPFLYIIFIARAAILNELNPRKFLFARFECVLSFVVYLCMDCFCRYDLR